MHQSKQNRPAITVSSYDLERLEGLLVRRRVSAPQESTGLRSELDRARIVEPSEMPPDVVTMNTTVRFAEEGGELEFERTLSYPHEMGQGEGRISILAPVGSALLGLSVGQRMDWEVPGGRMARVRILQVIHQPERSGGDRG
mgnify:CR=1 FL=1